MKSIPKSQNRPPAGLANELAYLPSCDDVQSRAVDGVAEFYVTRAKDDEVILYRGEPNAHWQAWLGSAGLCKVGGDSVPIMSPEDAIAVQPEVIPIIFAANATTTAPNYTEIAIGAVVITAAVVVGLNHIKESREFKRYE